MTDGKGAVDPEVQPDGFRFAHELRGPLRAVLDTLRSAQAASAGSASLDEGASVRTALAALEGLCARLPVLPEVAACLSPPLSTGKPTVLMVGRGCRGRRPTEEALAQHFSCTSAHDEVTALGLARQMRPDVVVLDLGHPPDAGLSLLQLLQGHEDTLHVPVVVISPGDAKVKLRSLQLGAYDYIGCPANPDEVVVRVQNAARSAQALKQERRLKETDDLTGLCNRRSLRSFTTAALLDGHRNGTTTTVVMIDQNDLKRINDTFGHAAGDAALRAVANALSAAKRTTDCAARLGGDEFAVVMPNTDKDGATHFIERMEGELRTHPVLLEGQKVQVAVSYGLACTGDLGWTENWEQILQRADASLYRDKRARKEAASADPAWNHNQAG